MLHPNFALAMSRNTASTIHSPSSSPIHPSHIILSSKASFSISSSISITPITLTPRILTQNHKIEGLLDAIMHLLLKIESGNLIAKQRAEHSVWRGRVMKCARAWEELSREWNQREVIPVEWRDIEGETFLERVAFLWKSTKEFYEHLEFYARFFEGNWPRVQKE